MEPSAVTTTEPHELNANEIEPERLPESEPLNEPLTGHRQELVNERLLAERVAVNKLTPSMISIAPEVEAPEP